MERIDKNGKEKEVKRTARAVVSVTGHLISPQTSSEGFERSVSLAIE